MQCDAVTGLEATRACTGCGQTKPLSKFHKNPKRPNGINSRCKACRNAKAKQRRLAKPDVLRNYYLKYEYGVTVREWEALFEAQDKKCAICRSVKPHRKKAIWHTDHDHKTGKVRGILCSHCNQMIGMAHEDPAIMLAGAAYLKQTE
jgi:hypothetical protein